MKVPYQILTERFERRDLQRTTVIYENACEYFFFPTRATTKYKDTIPHRDIT